MKQVEIQEKLKVMINFSYAYLLNFIVFLALSSCLENKY